jgi:uncharacterized protein YqhQ
MSFLGKMWRFLLAVQLLPALESGEETLVGGQAVLEGVMMRSPHAWAIAVRTPDGKVATHSEALERPSEKHKWMGWPIVRGVMTLGYAMSLGFRALRFSANVALDQIPADEKGKKLEISGWLATVNIILSLGFFILMYKLLPLMAATELKRIYPVFGGRILFNLVDGIVRLAVFLFFIFGTSLLKDIRRVYQYHGAEHKTVFAFENHDPLETGAVQKYSTYHPRCGTSFLMTVMIISGQVRRAHRIVARDRRPVVRDHPLRRPAPRIAVRAHDRPGPLAAAHHHPASRRYPGAMRHYRLRSSHGPGKAARRRAGDCLAAVVGRRPSVVGFDPEALPHENHNEDGHSALGGRYEHLRVADKR